MKKQLYLVAFENMKAEFSGGKSMNKYYQFSDGWFTYYINVETGDKKFSLDKDDVLIESNLDDFSR